MRFRVEGNLILSGICRLTATLVDDKKVLVCNSVNGEAPLGEDFVSWAHSHKFSSYAVTLESLCLRVRSELEKLTPQKVSKLGVAHLKFTPGEEGVNPQTGTTIRIPAKQGIHFLPHPKFLDRAGLSFAPSRASRLSLNSDPDIVRLLKMSYSYLRLAVKFI